jgi:hypothetical protein
MLFRDYQNCRLAPIIKKPMKLLFLLILLPFVGLSQTQTITNQKTFGTGFDEESFTSKVYDGYLYSFINPSSSGVSQDKTVAGFGAVDGWFVKMDLNFNVIWQKVYGGDNFDYAVDFVNCANGDFILLLRSTSEVSGNKTVPRFDFYGDYWVVRINSVGDILWQKVFGGNDEEDPSKIIKINENKFVLFGTSRSPISGNKNIANFGNLDGWAVFIDGQGNLLNQTIYGGSSSEQLGLAAISTDSTKLIFGLSSFSSISGNKTIANNGFVDGWIFTTDTNGVLLNQICLGVGPTSASYIQEIFVTSTNKIVVVLTGEFGTAGTKTVTGFGSYDAWVVVLDENLNVLNQFAYGGLEDDVPTKVSESNGNLIYSISSSSGATGNKSELNYGGIDNWYVCTDLSGTILWQKSVGGNQNENSKLLKGSLTNEYIVVSNTVSGISGNKTVPLYVSGSSDLWMYKLSTTLSLETNVSHPKISVSPNPFDDNVSFVWSESLGEVYFSLTDAHGKTIERQILSGQNNLIWSGRDLPAGIYFYSVETSNGVSSGRIVKQ